MRLINTTTLKLEEFPSEVGLEYVVLSHRWEEDEVSFQDFKWLETARLKKGFRKIQDCCVEAWCNGYSYAWVDTCCINKESDSQLSEAINSMFRWYKNAAECYVYLSDVDPEAPDMLEEFISSKWFKRGWTLQELLAPERVYFFDKTWRRFGSKKSLVAEIVKASGIEEAALTRKSIQQFSIAQRMCWAATRETSRPEDRAYSLMGIFNVNMPMLYGEGEKAFLRLQEEIIKHSSDQSIFAWKGVPKNGSGLLASSPDNFAESTDIVHLPNRPHLDGPRETQAYSMTNLGLSVGLHITPWAPGTYLAQLDCGTMWGRVGIFLLKLRNGQYRRIKYAGTPEILDYTTLFYENDRAVVYQAVEIPQDGLTSSRPGDLSIDFSCPQVYGIKLMFNVLIDSSICISSSGSWDAENNIALLKPGQSGVVATIDLRKLGSHINVIRVGFDTDFRPRCVLASVSCDGSSEANPDAANKYIPLSNKSIWDVDFAEIQGWNRTQGGQANVQIAYPLPYRHGTMHDTWSKPANDLWALQLDGIRAEAFFDLRRRPHLNQQGKFLGKIHIDREVNRAEFVWAMKFDLEGI